MRKYSLFLIVLLVVTLIVTSVVTTEVKANPDWLAGWDQRVKIEIDSGDIDSDLSSFPILIFLSNSSSGQYDEDVSFIFDEVGANSKKIALTVGEDTETFVEIEKWDSTNEQAWLWANVTATSETNQTLYLYYDNDHADNTAYVDVTETGNSVYVWDSDFKAVYHMRDNTTSSIADSTSNNNDGTKTNPNEPIVTTSGMIDDAQDFDGVDDWIDCQAGGSLDVNSITIEAWSDIVVEPLCFVAKSNAVPSSPYRAYTMAYKSTSKLVLNADISGTFREVVVENNVAPSGWQYQVATYNGSYGVLYRNGTEIKNTAVSGSIGSHPTWKLYIANSAYGAGYADAPNGVLDELRISGIARAPSWLKASYESGIDDLLDFGIEETAEEEEEEEIPFSGLMWLSIVAVLSFIVAMVFFKKR